MTDHVIQHHEGGGKPSDGSLAFIGTKGYSYGIGGSVKPNGATYWQRFRSPSQDFSTAGANHTTMGVCLSGDRDTYPVTAADLLAMREIAADARARGDLTPAPYVTPHREMPPPNNTICPGNQVAFVHPPKFPAGNNLVWVAVVAAYHEEQVPMPPKVTPEFFPPIGISALAVFTHPTRGRCAVAATPDGHIYCDPPDAYLGSPYDDKTGQPKAYWKKPDGTLRACAELADTGHGYRITTPDDEPYAFPDHA